MSSVLQCIWIKYFNVCVSAIVKLLRVMKMVFNSASTQVLLLQAFTALTYVNSKQYNDHVWG